jgi:hypothetical protein
VRYNRAGYDGHTEQWEFGKQTTAQLAEERADRFALLGAGARPVGRAVVAEVCAIAIDFGGAW